MGQTRLNPGLGQNDDGVLYPDKETSSSHPYDESMDMQKREGNDLTSVILYH